MRYSRKPAGTKRLLADEFVEADQAQLFTVVLGSFGRDCRELIRSERQEDPTSKFCSFEEVFAGNFAVL